MAKNNNVKDFTKDIADAIRAKTGTTAKINPQNFSTVILSIESGANDKPDVGKAMLVTYAKNNFETPLKNVLTTIKSGSTSLASGYTDSQGRFAQQVDSGTYTITTGAKDYHKVPESRQVTADADKATYVYMDYDATTLTVTAKKDDGTPIPNVALTAVMNYGGNVYNIGGSTKENGVGVIIVPPATGTLKVKTNIDGYYTPASPSVTTTLGQNTDVELIYNRIVTALDLSVVDYKGSPVSGASVVVTGPNTYSGETDDSGKFYREVLAGTYTISVTAPSGLLSPEDTAIVVQQDTVQSVTVVCQKDMSAIDPVFGNNSLETIVSVANEISLANMTSTQVESTYGWHIGDTVNIPLTTGENIEMRIIGFNHDDLSYDNYKAGITLEMTGCLKPKSYAVNYLSSYIPNMPQVLQDGIQNVLKTVYARNGTVSTQIYTSFALADVEIRGADASTQLDGTQYEYWSTHNTAEDRIKLFNGEASSWWLRTGVSGNAQRYVTASGTVSQRDYYYSEGVSEAFCIGNGALVGYEAPEYFKPFSLCTPEEIISAANNIAYNNMSVGDVQRTYGWQVGDEVDLVTITGITTVVRIADFMHDDITGGGKAGMTLETVDCWADKYKMSTTSTNAGGYPATTMRNTYLPAIKKKLPQVWQDAILAVDKKSSNGGGDNYTETLVTSEELFLFSYKEYKGTSRYAWGEDEGEQYLAWKLHGSSYMKKRVGTADAVYWHRSCGDGTTNFIQTTNVGGYQNSDASLYAQGVSFAFCIGSANNYVPSDSDLPQPIPEEEVIFSRTFGDNTPSQIAAVSALISKNEMTSAQVAEAYGWNIGDTVTVPLTTGENIEMRIIGFNHDKKSAERGQAGITLESVGCLSDAAITYGSSGVWTSSKVYSLLHNTVFKNRFPQEWADVVKPVVKGYHYWNIYTATNNEFRKSNDSLFILSNVEINPKGSESYSTQSTTYEYYNVDDASLRVKDSSWWTRSLGYNYGVTYIDTAGASGRAAPNTDYHKVSFAFCV